MLRRTDLFVSGESGYHTYRIPALIVTPQATALAFCEGRRHSRSDTGDIDLVLRRSRDGGEAWEPMQVLWDDGPNTVGNPCAVVDRDTGIIWLLLTHNLGEDGKSRILHGTSRGTRTVWVTHSADAGASWARPREITQMTKAADWTWYATGPGVGIQLRSGRLVIPCDHALAGTKALRSHIIYSDDHGQSWRIGGVADEQTNECQVAELSDGSLLLNMRSYHGRHRRAVARSWDEGLNWSEVTFDETLIEPVCQASLLRYSDSRSGAAGPLLFSNPASVERVRMTVRRSDDEGASWPASKLLWAGPAAYSCLTALPNGEVACLYEGGEQHPCERISLARFPLAWLAA